MPQDELKILGQDLYDTWEARGDLPFFSPPIDPGPCIVCGMPHTTCTGHEYSVPPSPPLNY